MSDLIHQLDNPCQRNYPRVLFICSAGMLRSATAAHHFVSRGWNTRCAGTEEYAVQPVHENTLLWAEKIYVMEETHLGHLERKFNIQNLDITVLGVPDMFNYMDPELIQLLEDRLDEAFR